MATSITELKSLLEEAGLNFFVENRGLTLLVPLCASDEHAHILVRIHERGEFIQFRIPSFLNASKATNREVLFARLLDLNYHWKVGHFGVDTTDGEISLEMTVAIEDGDLTVKQIRRIINVMSRMTDEYRPKLRKLLETGEDFDADESKMSKRSMETLKELEKQVEDLTRKLKAAMPEEMPESLPEGSMSDADLEIVRKLIEPCTAKKETEARQDSDEQTGGTDG